ncbi:uncharacterized protein LOC110986899 [Acanthaster planci]|uniref:Uncharacterized protein LOC110986899 n=1 Tax=Acanthaster planci TaxID=133434 RepID=A0A8B7ZIN8_ACAPL|nr:uncharacterized protein LOC110986899 [Acanthaster planci]XP_022104882.1 uncharacterized protein LOC110986899 [Acanthaster planci]XP_022104883.1 uncharacterized protein LOC110986899 [Acanthaster planci]
MASAKWHLQMLRAVVFVVTLSFASSYLPTESDAYDTACFVPSSERPRDGDKLLDFEMFLPPYFGDVSIEYLSFPNGSCGLDSYVLLRDRYFLIQFKDMIQREASAFFSHCMLDNQRNMTPPFRFTVMSLGPVDSSKLVPDEEFSRLPAEWISTGVIFRVHVDNITVGHHVLNCDIPYMLKMEQSQYNLNFTLLINGCPSGKYGGSCDQSCHCAEGVECHSFNGVCMCPLGLEGTSCDQHKPVNTVQTHHIFVPYGETFTLTCTVHGMPLPRAWSWTKIGQTTPLLATSREETMPYSPRPVVIQSIVEAKNTSVNGAYVCEVIDWNGTPHRQLVNVTVMAIPEPFVQVPQNQTALVGSNVTFTCKIRRDAGVIRWVRGQKQLPNEAAAINDLPGRFQIFHPSEGVSSLRILRLEFGDEEVFRCYAGHTFRAPDLMYAEARLKVQSDPYPECSFNKVTNTLSGQKLTLRCLVMQAKPVPRLNWGVQGLHSKPMTFEHRSDDGFSYNINTSLTLVPGPDDDGKRLSLSLTSPAWTGTREVETSLNVSYAPIVAVSPDPVTVIEGQVVTVFCSAKANPDQVDVIWTLRSSSKPVASVSSSLTYTFKNIDMEYDRANLTCSVGNTIGKTEKTVQIKVTGNSISIATKIGFSVSGAACFMMLLIASVVSRRYRKEIKLWWAQKAGKTGDKDFDVFISYKSSSPDEEFVMHELIPRLEQAGYRVCVHYRYFLPGRSIIENIADAVHRSRKTLLLLSPGFIESEWCCYEFQAALSQMLHLQSDLIPVIFEDLGPQENLSSDLQTILRTLSYVTWPGAIQQGRNQTDADLERFWKLLWQSLPPIRVGQDEQAVGTVELDLQINQEQRARMDGFEHDHLAGDRAFLFSY